MSITYTKHRPLWAVLPYLLRSFTLNFLKIKFLTMSFRNSFRRIKSRFSRPRRSRSYASPRRSKRSRTIRKTKIFGFSLGTVVIILAAAYIFIAPVKTFVNGLIGKKDV